MSENRNVMTDQTTLERELVSRARKGDSKAFEDLVRMYQEPVSYTHLTLPTILLV